VRSIWLAIWGGIKAVARRLAMLFETVAGLLQSALLWIVGLLGLAFHWLAQQFETAIQSGMGALSHFFKTSDYLTPFSHISPLAAYWLRDVFAMDVAFEELVVVASVWILCRTSRALVVPIRALLELL
jgi:hypothetical protein